MRIEEYFAEYALTLNEAVDRLYNDRRDVLAHKRPLNGGEFAPRFYRLAEGNYRNMSKGAIMARLESEFMSFAKG